MLIGLPYLTATAVLLLGGAVTVILWRWDEARRQLQSENQRMRARLDAAAEAAQGVAPPALTAPLVYTTVYKIITVGLAGVGKTTLTYGWANPLMRPEEVEATIQDRYQHVVSRVWDPQRQADVRHVFEVLDWGGEFRNEAQSALLKDPQIGVVLFVVDLDTAARGGDWIQQQIDSLDPQSLRFFFSRSALEHCQTFVLFINKVDLLMGSVEHVEQEARQRYAVLIDALEALGRLYPSVDIQVMVGSASLGQGSQRLRGHLIRRLLPKEAYDEAWRRDQDTVLADAGHTLP